MKTQREGKPGAVGVPGGCAAHNRLRNRYVLDDCLPSICPSVHQKMSHLSCQILVSSPWTVHAIYTVIVILAKLKFYQKNNPALYASSWDAVLTASPGESCVLG